MKKSLEALEYYWSLCNLTQTDYELIKQDLERLEQLEKENQELWYNVSKQAYLLNSKHIDSPFIERYQKAIEIMKYKFVNIPVLIDTSCFDEYCMYVICNELTEQEYDLLKEVLG